MSVNPESRDEDEQLLDNFKGEQRPPNIKLAQLHALARRVGEPRANAQNNKQPKICPCCGFQIDNEQLEICVSNEQFGFIGCGIPMFFSFIKYCIFFLSILFVVHGIYGLVRNKNGNFCRSYQLVYKQSCSENIANIFSAENSKNQGVDNGQSGLNCLCMTLLILSTVAFRISLGNMEKEIDDENITASDYSIMMSNMPVNENEEDIIKFFQSVFQNSVQVKKVVFTYDISQLIELKSKKANWQNKEKNLIVQQKDGEDVKEKLSVVTKAIQNIDNQIEDYEKICLKQGFQQTGVVFVSFNTEQQVDIILNEFNKCDILNAICCNLCNSTKKYKNNTIQITRAPEPSDIMWQNLGVDPCDRLGKMFLTFLVTSVFVGLCYLILYYLSVAQENLKQRPSSNNNNQADQDNSSGQQAYSFLASLCIVFINQGLVQLIKALTFFEKPETNTNYFVSVAIKLGFAQFFNTVILTFVVNQNFNQDKYMVQGGLVSDVYYLFLISAYLPLFLSYFNPWYGIKLWKQKSLIQQGQQSLLTQLQANQIFEGPIFDVAVQYASIVKTVLLSCFYVALIPGSLFISITGLIVQYWLTKYLLLRRYSCPQQIGSQLSKAMINQFIEFAILLFAIGCMVFEKNIHSDTSVFSILHLIFSIFYYITPNTIVNKCSSRYKGVQSVYTYDQVHLNFLSDYDRCNPITMVKATKQWMEDIEKFYNQKATQQQQSNQNQQNYLQQPQTNRFEGINTYFNRNLFDIQMQQQWQFNNFGQNSYFNQMSRNLLNSNHLRKHKIQINQIVPQSGRDNNQNNIIMAQSQVYQPVLQNNPKTDNIQNMFQVNIPIYNNQGQQQSNPPQQQGILNPFQQLNNNYQQQIQQINSPGLYQQQQQFYQQQPIQQQIPLQPYQQIQYQQQYQQIQFQQPQFNNQQYFNQFNNYQNPNNVVPMTINKSNQ